MGEEESLENELAAGQTTALVEGDFPSVQALYGAISADIHAPERDRAQAGEPGHPALGEDFEEPLLAAQLDEQGDSPEQDRPAAPDEQARQREVAELQRNHPVLQADELQRAQYLQQTLSNLLPLFADNLEKRAGETDREFHQRLTESQREKRERLQLEKEAGVFGPATREAYQLYVNWLQSRAVPEAVREMDSLQLAIPPGCPLTLPVDDQYQRTIMPELYRAMASNNELSANLALDSARIPTEAQLQRLDSAYEWLASCNEAATEARGLHQDRMLNQLITEMGLPEGWKRRPDENPVSWRASAAEMVDLATRTRNYVEAMQSLYKASRDRDFPLELPPGTRLTVELNGRTHQITDRDINEPHIRSILKNGSIKEVRLDLPSDLRQDHPANQQKIQRLRDWLTRHGERIDQAVGELVTANPESILMYGDQEIRNGRGRFNENGEFIGIAGPDYQARPGETLREVNLVGHSFDVEDLGNGKFRVSQTIQAENAPWYAYQNLRFLGIDKIGKPMKVETRELDGDAFVPVRNGDKIEIVQVKNLARFKAAQQFSYWGEKALVTTMDAAMLVSGTIEIAAAVRGARLAVAGAQGALALTRSEAAWQVAKGGLRVTVAGAGILNNSGGRELAIGDWRVGEHVNTARGLYFLGDVSLGLARGGWSFFRAARPGEPLSAAEKVHTIIHGRQAVNGAEAIQGIPFVRQVHTGSSWAFKATEYGFAPVIASELSHQVQRIRELGHRDPARDAAIQVGDGRGMQLAREGAFNPADARAVEGARAVLDNYSSIMRDGRSVDTQREIQRIFDEAKELIGSDIKDEDRNAFMQKMIALMTFTGNDIRDLELAHPQSQSQDNFRLTDQQLRDLLDPEKRKAFPKAVQEVAERILNGKDKDIAAAARLAMLYVARDANGRLPESLGEIRVSVPSYEKTVYDTGPEGERIARRVTVGARPANESVSTVEVVDYLKRDLESPSLGNRGIVTGDVLTRIGAIAHHQYGGLLQDVLRDSNASKSDKMRAMVDSYGARFATVIDGTRYAESLPRPEQSSVDRQRDAGRHFGLSSSEMISTLEAVASNDADPDVRAMAAAQLYAINERDPYRRAELLSALNTMWQECQARPDGEFSRRAVELLRRDMQAAIPEGELGDWVKERRLNAALSLARITPATDADGQRAINRAIAESFSTSNLVLAVKVVESLIPRRIQQLSTSDAPLANNVRAAVVEMTRNLPDNRTKEEALNKLLANIEPLLRNGEPALRQQVCRNLESLLDNNQYNRNYAEHFPALRVAAINALSDLGSRDSFDAIRRHATAEAKITAGNRELDAGENNAAVRMAAIRALERMQDPEIRSYIATLIDKETDPQVASRLRDIRFFQQRLEPGSREYQEIRQQIEAQVINPSAEAKYPHMADFGQQRARDWLNEHFPYLNAVEYRRVAQNAIDDAAYGFPNLFRSRATILNMERDGAKTIQDERDAQWSRLVSMARGSGADADRARRALYYIATSPVADMLGEGGQAVGLHSDYDNDYQFTGFRHPNWRNLAAEALASCCGTGCSSRDMTAHYIEQALTSTSGLSHQARIAAFRGLKELASAEGRNEPGITREKLAQTLTRALELELRRPAADQNEEYQLLLVRELRAMQYRMAVPVFDGLARSRFQAVKDEAAAALTALRDSVVLIWEQTVPDQNANAEQRAQRVRSALADSNNAERTVQEIFSAYKGYKISAGDPAIAQLQVAMQDTNERVRLAAAKVLMTADLPNNNAAKAKAVQVLAELVMSSTTNGYRTEAFAELSRMELPAPLHLMLPGNRLLKLEKNGSQLRATEFEGNKEVGWIYPGGGSMRIFTDASGNLTRFVENGAEYRRKQEGSRWLDEWERVPGGRVWRGRYEMLANGSYWFQEANQSKRWTRSAQGTWTQSDVPWVAR